MMSSMTSWWIQTFFNGYKTYFSHAFSNIPKILLTNYNRNCASHVLRNFLPYFDIKDVTFEENKMGLFDIYVFA